MLPDPSRKYHSFPVDPLPDRTWPDAVLRHPPRWCSVDLRDGNQALPRPMNVEQKLRMFDLLCAVGFKEIEISYPAASATEYAFTRYLIENKKIPDDVTIQVITPAREALIERTCQALRGAKHAIMHLYVPLSELQRRVVFRKSQEEMLTLAVAGARWCGEYAQRYLPDTRVDFEYTPESFTGTETEYAGHVCSAVIEQWQPSIHREVIINAAATVELSSPNHFADKVESLRRLLGHYGEITLSLHCHNDRGCAVAATELGQMAGAERVEGTLFGNGERTGNVDLITLAMNLYTQGIDPKLDFSDLDEIASVYAQCTGMNVHDRHPYAGRLVHCAFSGTHQDAINKGLSSLQQNADGAWDVPYLPLDPRDVGRSLEDIVRINAQSGRGGLAHILSARFGIELSKEELSSLAVKVQEYCDQVGREILPEEVRMFLAAQKSRQNAEILG